MTVPQAAENHRDHFKMPPKLPTWKTIPGQLIKPIPNKMCKWHKQNLQCTNTKKKMGASLNLLYTLDCTSPLASWWANDSRWAVAAASSPAKQTWNQTQFTIQAATKHFSSINQKINFYMPLACTILGATGPRPLRIQHRGEEPPRENF